MVKKKTKNYVQLGILLFGILLSTLFINCERDYLEKENEYDSNIKVKSIKHNEVVSNSKIKDKLLKYHLISPKIKSNKNNQERLIYSDEFEFTIDTDNVKYVENTETNYHSYSFPLIRDNPENQNVENLLLSLNQDGNYDVFIVTYDFTEEEFDNIDQNTLSTRTTIYEPIDLDTSIFTPDDLNTQSRITRVRFIAIETWSYVWVPNTDGQLYGSPVGGGGNSLGSWQWVLTGNTFHFLESTNSDYGNGSGQNGDDGDGDGSSSSPNSSGNIDNITSTPAFSEEETPCDNLKSLSNPNGLNLNQKIQQLKDKLDVNTKNEWSITFQRKKEYNYQTDDFDFVYLDSLIEGSGNTSVLYTAGYYFGGIHLHPKGESNIPSWGDIYGLNSLYNNVHGYNEPFVTLMVVCDNPIDDPENPYVVYALKVENDIALQNSIDALWDNSDLDALSHKEKMEKLLAEDGGRQFEQDDNDLEKYFLEFYQNYGISIYKASDDLSNWNKLSLNNQTGTNVVLSTPCN